jgi:uncharacterized protein
MNDALGEGETRGKMSSHLDSEELKINVVNLVRNPFTRERVQVRLLLELGETGLGESAAGCPVDIDLWLDSSPDGIRVTGNISGTLPLQCTRCTEPVGFPLIAKVDEFFCRRTLPLLSPDGREEAEVPPEESYRLEGEEMDLSAMVNDQVLLSLPIKRLCREDCRGMCPHCGSNLNLGNCDCREEQVDPRLEKLKLWLDREGSE